MKKHHAIQCIVLLITLFAALMGTNAFAQDDGRPRLGLSVSPLQVPPLMLQHLRLAEGEGLMVNNIVVGGELEAAGISQGDIILAIDGHPVSRPSEITSYIATLPPNTQVTLDVIQKGEHRQIYLKLDNLPDDIVWKYAKPVSRPRMNSLLRSHISPGTSGPNMPALPQGGISANSTSVFKSIVSTEDGIQDLTVVITGPSDDPNSEIEITIGSDQYKTTIAEIDSLPEEARNAAHQAVDGAGGFSFSFGGSFGGDIFEEMMRQQDEHERMMEEMFRQMFNGDPMPQQPRQEKEPVLKPVEPAPGDIRS